jgi:hypothetical protein
VQALPTGADICSCNICIHHIPVDYVGKGREHDCMDAGGTTPRMGEVELRLEQQSRAMQGAIAEERKLRLPAQAKPALQRQ